MCTYMSIFVRAHMYTEALHSCKAFLTAPVQTHRFNHWLTNSTYKPLITWQTLLGSLRCVITTVLEPSISTAYLQVSDTCQNSYVGCFLKFGSFKGGLGVGIRQVQN